MVYQTVAQRCCQDGCCVVGRDEDDYPLRNSRVHSRPMYECYADHFDEDWFDDESVWSPFHDDDPICTAIRDTEGNVLFPELCDPSDQPCPYPKPPPTPPKKEERDFAIAA